jgi:hypothetical protein
MRTQRWRLSFVSFNLAPKERKGKNHMPTNVYPIRRGLLCLGLLGAFTLAVTAQQTPSANPAKQPSKPAEPVAAAVPPELTPVAQAPVGHFTKDLVAVQPKGDEGGIAGGVPANDNCASPTPLTCGGAGLLDDNNNATLDGPTNPSCSFGGAPINSDVWYSFVATSNSATVSLCPVAGTHTDTLLVIYSGTCGNLTEVGCNDDSCGLVSQATAVNLTIGQTYLVQAGGWNLTATGSWTITVTCTTSSCPTCTDNEGEPTCGPNYVDATNGGCNSTPPVFTPIGCGQTVCGESGTYLFGASNYRDTDWWLVNVTAPNTLTWTVTADFPVLIGFIGQPCPQLAFLPGTAVTGAACTTVTTTAVGLAPGQYVAFVAPSVFTGVPCTAKYEATLTGTDPANCVQPAPLGRCCVGTACSVLTQAQCNTAGGNWTAGGTCPPSVPGYNESNCTNILEDISTTGTIATASSACDDCSDLNIPIGFSFNYFGNTYSTIRICSNGFCSFDQAGPSTFGNVAIPNAALPNDIVCPFWDDFNFAIAASGDVRYQTLAGPQRFIVQWTNAIQFAQTTGSATFQMILFGDGTIQFRYGTMTPAAPYTPTVGVENATGTVGTNMNPAGPSAGNTCRLLTPAPPPPNPCANCPGDTDGDSDVDADDLTNVILQWGNTCPCNADVDNDNDVDSDDLTVVILEWGTPC